MCLTEGVLGGCGLPVLLVVVVVKAIKIVNGLTIARVIGIRLPVRCEFARHLAARGNGGRAMAAFTRNPNSQPFSQSVSQVRRGPPTLTTPSQANDYKRIEETAPRYDAAHCTLVILASLATRRGYSTIQPTRRRGRHCPRVGFVPSRSESVTTASVVSAAAVGCIRSN